MGYKNRRKWWLSILGLLIIIIIILIIFANNILSHKVDAILRKQIATVDTNTYLIDFQKVKVDIFTSSVKIFDISIKPSDNALSDLKHSRFSPPMVEASIPKLKIFSIGIFKFLRKNEIDIGGISLTEPEIFIYTPNGIFNDDRHVQNTSQSTSPDTLIEDALSKGSVSSFNIYNANIKLVDMQQNKAVIVAKKLSLEADGISVKHPENDLNSHMLDVADIYFSYESGEFALPGGFYSLRTGEVKMDYAENQLRIDSFALIPEYPKNKFGREFGKQTDRFEIDVTNLKLKGIIFDSLINKKVIVEEIDITRPHVDIYRDKRVPRDLSQRPKLFQTALAELPIQVNVGKVNLFNTYLIYQEMVEYSPGPGKAIFDDMKVEITGIQNDPDSIRKGSSIKIDGSGLLMGKTNFSLSMDLPMGRSDEYFTFSGYISKFPAENINPMIEPLAFVAATAGTINSVEYYCLAKNDTAIGRLVMEYKDLEVIAVKKEKKGRTGVHENRLLSFFAKTVIHKENPKEGKPPRVAKTFFIRDRNKGFFNYVWKDVQSGLINSLTPGKKHLAQDMTWPVFKQDWQRYLNGDWDEYQIKYEKKKKKQKK